MRLKMTIAYDGRPYEGWATQPGGNTVQDFLEGAIAEVAKQATRVYGSGRTDTGVHALGQVAHFDVPDGLSMNAYNWVPAINSKLPATIRVMDCEQVAGDFHARFSAVEKTYTYDLCLAPVLPPLSAGLAWHLPRQLDPVSLEQALEILAEMGLADKAESSSASLSQVELRKMELARAMAAKPQLLISDEAMAGLSGSEVDDVLDILIDLNKSGITIIMIEHIMHAVMRFSERLVCLDAGQIICDGDPQTVVANPQVHRAYLGD